MNRTITIILMAVVLLFLMFSTYFVQVYNAAQEAGTKPQYFSPPENQEMTSQYTFVIIAMLAGIVSQYLFEKTKKSRDGRVNIKSILAKMITNSRFIMALAVSPLIFNSVFLVIGNNPQGIGDYLLAFQNGFFWQSIVNGFSSSD